MKTFKVHIEETVVDTFTVEAETEEEAMEIAEANYYNGEFVLAPGSVVTKQMSAEDENGKTTEWVEF